MAEKAAMPPTAPDDNLTEDLTDAPQDLIVRANPRVPEQHMPRIHKHDHAGEDWSEAQSTVEADMAQRKKTGS
jgi:hypothetical protein